MLHFTEAIIIRMEKKMAKLQQSFIEARGRSSRARSSRTPCQKSPELPASGWLQERNRSSATFHPTSKEQYQIQSRGEDDLRLSPAMNYLTTLTSNPKPELPTSLLPKHTPAHRSELHGSRSQLAGAPAEVRSAILGDRAFFSQHRILSDIVSEF